MARSAQETLLRRLGKGAAGAVLGGTLAVAAPDTLVADRLLAVSHLKECRVTTVGRSSGTPHAVTTWFLVDGDSVYLATLDTSRDWVRNARAKGEVSVDFGSLAVTGTFADVTDPDVEASMHDALRRKYWMAWIGGWFGRGPEAVFRVDDLQLVEAGAPSSRPAAGAA